jgi:hypothetical protein
MIASGTGDTVSLNVTPVTIASVQLGGSAGPLSTLSTNASTHLTVTNSVAINATGELQINQGSGLVAGSVTNSGLFHTDVAGVAANTATISGTLTNNAGATVSLGVNGSADVMKVGTLQNNGAFNVGRASTLNLTGQASGLTVVNAGSSLVLYGTLSAAGGSGNGLNNLTTINGQLQINNGQSIVALPAGGKLSVASTGDLRINDGSNLTVLGNLSSSGNIETNTDTAQNTNSNTLTVTGDLMNHNGATLAIGLVQSTQGDHLNVGGTLTNNGSIFLVKGALTAGTISNASSAGIQVFGNTSLVANSLTNSGVIEGGVGGSGSTIQINGDATNSGVLNTTAVVNTLGQPGNSLTVTGTLTNLAGGSLNINLVGDTGSAASLNNQGAFTVGSGATLTVANDFTNSGTATISGSASASTLSNDSGATLNLSGGGQLTGLTDVMNGGAIVLTPNGTVGSGNLISMSGTFTNEAGGTVTLNGDGDVIDPMALDNGGTLNIADGLYFVGTGTAPTLATGAEYDQDAGGTLNEIFTSDSAFGVINDSGTADLAGTLNVELPNGFSTALGTLYDFLNYSSLVGAFDTFNAPVFDNGLETFHLIYNPTNAELEVVSAIGPATPEPATLLLSGLGAAALLYARRRRARVA